VAWEHLSGQGSVVRVQNSSGRFKNHRWGGSSTAAPTLKCFYQKNVFHQILNPEPRTLKIKNPEAVFGLRAWLIGRKPESPLAALSNNNDYYYAYKGEYFAKYRICDQGKHVSGNF
jgi:hypothetical protein